MMNIEQLAKEYRASGEACRLRAQELSEVLLHEKMGEMEKMRLRRRICILNAMARDAIATSKYLENYYGDDENGKQKHVREGRRVSVSAPIFEDDGIGGHGWPCLFGEVFDRGGFDTEAETACYNVLPRADAYAGYSQRA